MNITATHYSAKIFYYTSKDNFHTTNGTNNRAHFKLRPRSGLFLRSQPGRLTQSRRDTCCGKPGLVTRLAIFFVVAQVVLFAFSTTIYDAIEHYIDSIFFFTRCMLLSVMMVYKYWDSITKGLCRNLLGSLTTYLSIRDAPF